MISNIETNAGAGQDFARLAELQQKFNDADTKLSALEVTMNEKAQGAAHPFGPDYVVLHESKAALESDIKELFNRHPEWRGDGKSVKTPFGEVAQRTVTELEVPNAAMTVALIEAQGKTDPAFKAEDFLRVEKSPNVEALEGLGDDALAKLGVRRVKREQVTVKAAKVSVAKTVKAAKAKV